MTSSIYFVVFFLSELSKENDKKTHEESHWPEIHSNFLSYSMAVNTGDDTAKK